MGIMEDGRADVNSIHWPSCHLDEMHMGEATLHITDALNGIHNAEAPVVVNPVNRKGNAADEIPNGSEERITTDANGAEPGTLPPYDGKSSLLEGTGIHIPNGA